MKFIKESILNEMAMERSDAINRCMELGKKFIEHFDKIMNNKRSQSVNRWMNEMQGWFDQVDRIILKPKSKKILFTNLIDWFFTVGSSPEEYLNKNIEEYNDFIIELYKCKNVKKSFDSINIKFENSQINESWWDYEPTLLDILGVDTLYHATYKPYWEEIKKSGEIKGGVHSNWEGLSHNDVVYLSRDFDNAYSYAETAEDVPEEYLNQIIVLEIDATKLNSNLLHIDENQAYGNYYEVNVEDPSTWIKFQYEGEIPINTIKKVHDKSILKETLEEDSYIKWLKSKHPNIVKKLNINDFNIDEFLNNKNCPKELKESFDVWCDNVIDVVVGKEEGWEPYRLLKEDFDGWEF